MKVAYSFRSAQEHSIVATTTLASTINNKLSQYFFYTRTLYNCLSEFILSSAFDVKFIQLDLNMAYQ